MNGAMNDLDRARAKREEIASVEQHTDAAPLLVEPSDYARAVVMAMIEYMSECGLEPVPEITVEVDDDDPSKMRIIIPVSVQTVQVINPQDL